MMQKLTLIILVALAFSAGTAVAQQNGDGTNRVMSALERTDEVIATAREAVAESGSLRAQNMLQTAVEFQKRAHELIQNELTVMQAGKLTMNARSRAQQAIAISRRVDENEEQVRRRLEKTEEMLRRIGERLGGDTPDRAQQLYDSARERQERAMELFRERRLKMALQMTMQAEKTLENLAEKLGGYYKTQNRYQALLERYYMLKDRIEISDAAELKEVRKRLEQCEQLRVEAERRAEEDKYGAAEKAIFRATEQLGKIVESLREPSRLNTALERLSERADEFREEVATGGSEAVRQLYRNALEHLQKAREMIAINQLDAAAAQLQAARQTLNRVVNLLGE